MINKCAALWRNPRHFQNVARALTKVIRKSLIGGSQWQAKKAASEIGGCLKPETGYTNLYRSYAVLKCWYKNASARAPNPSWADMANTTK